jgi:hypothetical protein
MECPNCGADCSQDDISTCLVCGLLYCWRSDCSLCKCDEDRVVVVKAEIIEMPQSRYMPPLKKIALVGYVYAAISSHYVDLFSNTFIGY